MLLVIFGAGASYDSVPHLRPPSNPKDAIQHRADPAKEDRPPLANQLFENRHEFVVAMEQFKQCMPLIPSLQKRDVVVEQELARIREQAKTYRPVYSELAAIQYYLHFAMWECQLRWYRHHRGITNYAALLREIERWRYELNKQACFVTFNYDTMLEDAMRQVLRIEFPDISSYVASEAYPLVKLHGSIHWGRVVEKVPGQGGYDPERLIKEAADFQLSDQYLLVNSHPMSMEQGRLVFPALSIPVEKKDEFSCPTAHVRALEALLPRVTKLITIGWRATEADFLSILNKWLSGPDWMIVSGTSEGAAETFNNLTRAGLSYSRVVQIDDGFTGLIHQLQQFDAFLRGFNVAGAC